MTEQITLVLDSLKQAFAIISPYWWVYTPVFLLFGVLEIWQLYTRTKFLLSLKWVLLEIKPPPDVIKSPKIAENIFSGLHGIYKGPLKKRELFFEGKVQDWFALEIVGHGGTMRFYIRCLEGWRNLVESTVFAQYPDAEINLAQDYMDELPDSLPTEEYDLFGTELEFTKPDVYPLKTYPEFEEEKGKDEFVRTDPLSPLAELLSAMGPGEHLGVQLLIRPTGDDWAKQGQAIVDKMVGKEPKVERGLVGSAIDIIDSFIPGGAAPSELPKEKKEFSTMKLTPGEKFVLEKIQEKMAKLGFKSGYRVMYIARKDSFNKTRVPALIGVFKQFYLQNLNSFRPSKEASTVAKGFLHNFFPSDKGFFIAAQEYRKKYRLYKKYRKRAFVKKFVMLNTEELATLFHLPGIGVRAPAVPRVEAKKGQPPIGLPTREDPVASN